MTYSLDLFVPLPRSNATVTFVSPVDARLTVAVSPDDETRLPFGDVSTDESDTRTEPASTWRPDSVHVGVTLRLAVPCATIVV